MVNETAPSRNLSVMHVVDSLELGGLERVVTDLSIAQKADECSVSVFSINNTGGHRDTLEAEGIPVIQGGKRRTADPHVLRRLWQTIVRNRVDVVHAHNFVPNYYAAAALLPLRRRPPLVVTCHDMGQRLSDRRLRMLFRLSLARTARVAMVSQQVYQRYLELGLISPSSAKVILNGVPTDKFRGGAEARHDARVELDVPQDARVIGTVGRMVDLKNQRALIAAMPALLEAFPDVVLVMIGDGPLYSTLQAQAAAAGVSANVRFAGQRRNVSSLLHGLDVFVLPSLTEGLSIALLEATACGLPIVASNTGGNPEIVVHGETGLLVPVGDDDSLRDALLTILPDAMLRQKLGDAARAWVQANGSIDASRRAYHQYYLEALGARTTAPGATIAA
jgi:glycosyltransferase involved in cell wall biosynthesis